MAGDIFPSIWRKKLITFRLRYLIFWYVWPFKVSLTKNVSCIILFEFGFCYLELQSIDIMTFSCEILVGSWDHKILIFSDFKFESRKMTGRLQRSSWHIAGRFVTLEMVRNTLWRFWPKTTFGGKTCVSYLRLKMDFEQEIHSWICNI